MSADMHAARRARALELLGPRAALVVPAAPELHIGADAHLHFVQDTDLFYLTGHGEPEAVAVLATDADAPFTVFVRPRDADSERWTGARAGVEGAQALLGADRALSINELPAQLPQLLKHADTIYAPFDSQRPDVDAAVRAALLNGQRIRPRTGTGPLALHNSRALLARVRLYKDDAELELMREAARITVESFRELASVVRNAEGEWTLHAALEHGFRRRGAMGPAFPTIVAGGERATVLHYEHNDQPLARDGLVLVDAGARYRMYCADVTRTFPVSGRFSADQRALYDIVHDAHAAAVAAVRPGALTQAIDDAAIRVLVQGMIAVGLLAGSIDELIEKKEYKRYYPHRTSHWLGLDVHDAGDYVRAGGEPMPLEERFVLTIEPGLYIPADDDTAPPGLRGIGIRLEDDVLVTAAGNEVLTGALPIAATDIEALMGAPAP
jgi:Xaa-Pro aminopeptidase